jgi:RNAse (barnase) inhibitor barstar
MSLQHLTHAKPPWTHLLAATPSDTCDALWGLERTATNRLVARMIRGRKCKTREAFFDESAAALQFPYYFGDNWDAFNDCITDLAWLRADAVVVCITDANHLLEAAPAEQLHLFVTVLDKAAQRWNHPEKGHAAKPFHQVLQVAPGEEATLEKRMHAAGMKLERINLKHGVHGQ